MMLPSHAPEVAGASQSGCRRNAAWLSLVLSVTNSATIPENMDVPEHISIPDRAETLQVLRLMGGTAPMLMLAGDTDGYGARWILDGQQVQPAIATYLMKAGFLIDSGATEMGARKLALTDSGTRFRKEGLLWWSSLGFLEKLKIRFLG
jgi:hypothetical protein